MACMACEEIFRGMSVFGGLKSCHVRHRQQPGNASHPRVQKLMCSPEVDRAIDNLVKSGKMFNMPGRRDSMPMGGPPPRDFSQQYGKRHLPSRKQQS
jgi:hypothetical protein